MSESIKVQFRPIIRSKPSEQWCYNQVLLQGEIGYESDTGLWKIGDNLGTPWGLLLYQACGVNKSLDVSQFLTAKNCGDRNGKRNYMISTWFQNVL